MGELERRAAVELSRYHVPTDRQGNTQILNTHQYPALRVDCAPPSQHMEISLWAGEPTYAPKHVKALLGVEPPAVPNDEGRGRAVAAQ